MRMARGGWTLLVVLALLAAACSSESAVTTSEAPATTTETSSAPETTEATDAETTATTAAEATDVPFEGAFSDGDILTLITATDPGGGFDFQLRNLQPYVQEQIAELTGANVTVIVENIPGAGQLVGYETMSR